MKTRFQALLKCVVSALPALAIGVMAAVPAGQARAAEPVRIGFVGGLSGACGALTQSQLNGAQMALEAINANGGVLGGRPLELIVKDSKTKPDEGARLARELIVGDKVSLLTGPCSSAVMLAVSAVSKEFKVPLWSAVGNSQRANIEFWHPYFYNVQANALVEALAAAEYAARMGWKRVVGIGYDYEWGHMTVDTFAARLKELNPEAEVVAKVWPKIGETNMTSYVTAALANEPDAIFAAVFGGGARNLIRQGQAYGMLERTKLFTFLTVDALKALDAGTPDGIIGYNRAPFFGLSGDKVDAMVAAYKAKYNEMPDDWAILGFDGIMMAADALNAAGSTDADAYMTALHGLTFDGLRGPISIRAEDGDANAPVFIGTTVTTPDYPFAVMKDVIRIDSNKVRPDVAAIEVMRAAAR